MRRVSQLAAGIVLFREEGGARRYLLVRSALTRRPIWEFPKGGVEAGETDAQAAERELQEEAGVRAEDYRVIHGFEEEERYVFTQGKGERPHAHRQARRLLPRRSPDLRGPHLSRGGRTSAGPPTRRRQRLLRFPGKRIVLERAEAHVSRISTAH
jgi:8-oxo-dGTP pyrophosphatase MutT (NUDIX family)